MPDVDQVIQSIQGISPAVRVQQLEFLHPGADDDGIWFFDHPGSEFEVQIASGSGMCPFVIETDENDTRLSTSSVEETVEAVSKLLHLEPLE